MRSLALVMAVVCLCVAAPAPASAETRVHVHVPSRAELGQAIADLELKIAALREELQKGDVARAAAAEERLAALEKAVAEVRAAQGTGGASAAKLDEISAALDELKEEVATKDDLKKFMRKPDEKEFKSRVAQELELRMAFTDLREEEIENLSAGLGALAMSPMTSMKSRAIIQAAGGLGALLLENDHRARPRLMFRPTWETSRFVDDSHYLFVSATPEVALFVYDHDMDRAIIPRDVAGRRDRMGVIIKKAAAGAQIGRLGLQAGVLQFTYGAGFFINPTNVFTPKNPLDPRREVDGVPAAKLDLDVVKSEGLTLSAQMAAVADRVRNDVLAEHDDKLGFGGLATIKADTKLASLSAIGITQSPDAQGQSTSGLGGTVSVNPFGLTASVEGLYSERLGEWAPELVASIQGFTSKIGPNGTTYILEYVFNGHNPASRAEAGADLVRAVSREQTVAVLDQLTRPLDRRHYANVYLEPSITQRLRVNLAGLVGFDEAPGALLRGGFDYDYLNFTVHAFGGALVGDADSEFKSHFINAFGELAVFASF